jgi:hypothetical protein
MLSKAKRQEIARKAAFARWNKQSLSQGATKFVSGCNGLFRSLHGLVLRPLPGHLRLFWPKMKNLGRTTSDHS